MKKAPEAFRTISEVSELLETPAHVLRFWESKFYQIRPVKRAGGRRYYRPDDVALINGIRNLLQVQGLTIRGAQRVLQEKGVRHVIGLGADLPMILADISDTEVLADTLESRGAEAIEPAPALTDGDAPAQPGIGPAPQDETDKIIRDAPATKNEPAPVATPEHVTAAADDMPEPAVVRLPQLLRQHARDGFGARRDRAVALARRMDTLLDRMSEASGAGRW